MDIDNSLILRARAAAKNVPLPGNEKLARELLGVPWVPISFRLSIGALKTVAHSISFECEDYVATEDCTVEEYDVITCLSTIKWVIYGISDISRFLYPSDFFSVGLTPVSCQSQAIHEFM